jgi:hypothetical protein
MFHLGTAAATHRAVPKILAELDFAADLKTKNIVVPPMMASVVCDNPEALKGYDTKKERVNPAEPHRRGLCRAEKIAG